MPPARRQNYRKRYEYHWRESEILNYSSSPHQPPAITAITNKASVRPLGCPWAAGVVGNVGVQDVQPTFIGTGSFVFKKSGLTYTAALTKRTLFLRVQGLE